MGATDLRRTGTTAGAALPAEGAARRPRRLAAYARALLAAGVPAPGVTRRIGRVNDLLVRRLLARAEAALGPPPAPYAWLAMGSEGRLEQTLAPDQDNGLVYADAAAGARGWFEALARWVNAALVQAGFPECPGGHMARNEHGTLAEWRARFAACLDRPDPHDAEILLDFRVVGGTLDVSPLEAELGRAARVPLLLQFLAREALVFTPPSAWLLRLRGRSARLHVKRHGLSPIVFLARASALAAGSHARGTPERLVAAARGGGLDPALADALQDAFALFTRLRLELQLAALAAGRAPDDEVSLGALRDVDRRAVLAAVRVVKRWQARASYHFLAPG